MNVMSHHEPPRVLLLMGVAGCGKTTTGQKLARRLGWTFRDADSFHPPANIAKMTAGTPLTDDDRWPWLDAIAEWTDQCLRLNQPAVVTCSALKRAYRTRILGHRAGVQLVYLKGSRELIADRMSRRKNHFMPTALLDSQFATLEEPRTVEHPVVVSVAMSPNRVVDRIIAHCGLQALQRLPQAGSPLRSVSD